jgi:hypothetical protein
MRGKVVANNVLDTSAFDVKYPNFASALLGQFTILSTFDSDLIKQAFDVFMQCRFSNTLELITYVRRLINDLQGGKTAVNDPQIVINAVQTLVKSFIGIIIHTLENEYAITNNSLTWSTITNFRQLLGVNEKDQSIYSIDHSALIMPATGWFSSIINWWNKDKILASQLILQNLLILEIMTHTPFSWQSNMANFAKTKLSDITGLLQNDQSAYLFKLPSALRQNLVNIQLQLKSPKKIDVDGIKQASSPILVMQTDSPSTKRKLIFNKTEEVKSNTPVTENIKEGISLEELLPPLQQADIQPIEQKPVIIEEINSNDLWNTPVKSSASRPPILSPIAKRGIDASGSMGSTSETSASALSTSTIVSQNKSASKKRSLEVKNTVKESPPKKSKIVKPSIIQGASSFTAFFQPAKTTAKARDISKQKTTGNTVNSKPQKTNNNFTSTATPGTCRPYLRSKSGIERAKASAQKKREFVIEASRDTTRLSASKPTPKVKINA